MKLNETASSTDCKITNQTKSDLVVITPTSSVGGGSYSTPVKGQNLAVLNVTAGGQTIKAGGTGTVTLDQQFKDSKTGDLKPTLLYDLLFSDSKWYSPLANKSVFRSFSRPPTYAPQTASADDQKALSNTMTFLQIMMAYPTSKLTKGYQAALKGAQSSAKAAANGKPGSAKKVSSSITSSVNDFFASTSSYKNVTLSTIVAAQSYYNRFPFIWAQFKPTISYYLYGNSGTSVKTATFQGTLILNGTADLTKDNGGYTCTFNPAVTPSDTTSVAVDTSKAVSLTYNNGLFTSEESQGISQVSLKGTFMLKRKFTRVATDTTILKIITGTVFGTVVVGTDEEQKSDDKSGSIWSAIYKGGNWLLSKIMYIASIWMMADFVINKLKGEKKVADEEQANADDESSSDDASVSESDLSASDSSVDSEASEVRDSFSEGPEAPPNSVDDSFDDMDDAEESFEANADAASINEGFDAAAESLETQGTYEADMTAEQLESLESNASSLQEAQSNLSDAIDSQSGLGDATGTASSDLSEITSDISDLSTELGDSISAADKASLEANEQVATEVQEQIEEANKAEEENAENEDPEAEGLEDVPIE